MLLLKANLNTIEVLISKYIKSTDILVMRICIKRIWWNERRNKKSWNFSVIPYKKGIENYYIICKKYTANKNSSARKNKQNKLMLLLKWAIFDKKK